VELTTVENIWFFETTDDFTSNSVTITDNGDAMWKDESTSGGFIIANNEEEVWKRLSVTFNLSIEELKEKYIIYPMVALDLNEKVHFLW
jgi:hypothetical protein